MQQEVTRSSGHAIDDFALRVYEHVLDNGPMTVDEMAFSLGLLQPDVEAAVQELHTLRLLRADDAVAGTFVAVSPEAAELELTVPLELTIHDARRELASIHDRLLSFTRTFNERRMSRLGDRMPVVSTSLANARLRLEHLAANCTSEVLIIQSASGRAAVEPERIMPDVPGLLERGVEVRILCPHTARADAASRSRLSRLAAAGARVRTSNESFAQMVLFGSEAVFIPGAPGVSGDETQTTFAFDPTLIGFLRGMFEHVWEPAAPLDADTAGYGGAIGELRKTILELLASGLKDDVIARRLGMSSRTFRRHISTIMEELDAESRFQAGVRAAYGGLVTG